MSHQRAAAAAAGGAFDAEIAPVAVPQRKGDPVIVRADEGIRPDSTAAALGNLRPAFAKDGTITAGNASQISDGAAALVVADRAAAEAAGLPILAEIVAYGQAAGPDATLHERPAQALEKALGQGRPRPWPTSTWSSSTRPSPPWRSGRPASWASRGEKVNVHGGAVALGHPLGATGARIVVTLINALRRARRHASAPPPSAAGAARATPSS